MIYQIGESIAFDFFYTATKVGKTGLTPTIKAAYKNGAAIGAIAGAAIAEVGNGLYRYILVGGTYVDAAGDYVVIATSADATVDFRDIPSMNIVPVWVANVDATISSRSTLAAGAQMDLVNAPNGTAIAAIKTGLGTLDANLKQILGSALSETVGGYLAAAFKKFLDVATPLGTINAAILSATQGAITWAQQKIVANVADQGALHIVNTEGDGNGLHTVGGNAGQLNQGSGAGLYNLGGTYGQLNDGTTDVSPMWAVPGDKMDLKDAPNATALTAIAAAIWTYATRTLTSLSALLASIWSYGYRTLTQTAESILSILQGNGLTLYRGDTWSQSITGMGSLAGRTKLYFTAKRSKDDADSAAVIQVEETAGLLYLNGAAGTAGNGSLTVTDAVAGDVTVVLAAVEAAKLARESLYCDVQMTDASGTTTKHVTTLTITLDVTRATS